MSPHCPYCKQSSDSGSSGGSIRRCGQFKRKSDGATVQRYRCACRRTFSDATLDFCCWQKKRHLNFKIIQELVSGNSQRRTAYLVGVNKNTVERKFILLGAVAHSKLLDANTCVSAKAIDVQFDEMESFEHTKMKPISIHLAVESKTRRILNYAVSSMPCKGKLAQKSVQKYGPRPDHRSQGRIKFLQELLPVTSPTANFTSDKNPHYPKDLKVIFPEAQHFTTKGRRARDNGNGELKVGGFDPLFALNHTCAMHRENINRLKRKTWSTTKRIDRLGYHVGLYALFHNQEVITGRTKKKLAHQMEFRLF